MISTDTNSEGVILTPNSASEPLVGHIHHTAPYLALGHGEGESTRTGEPGLDGSRRSRGLPAAYLSEFIRHLIERLLGDVLRLEVGDQMGARRTSNLTGGRAQRRREVDATELQLEDEVVIGSDDRRAEIHGASPPNSRRLRAA
jgi:hypothetical protein